MFGPVFAREAFLAPRRPKTYVARSVYALALLVLMSTAWLALTGTQLVRELGDLARFGAALFQVLAPLQLALAVFFSALLAAGDVAHEKDRGTLELLLLSRLTNTELVLGKLAASLLRVLVPLAAALPVFLLTALFGGVSHGQIFQATIVTLVAILACGSIGSTIALWREKTFQSLALTVLALVVWLAAGEAVAWGIFGAEWRGLPCYRLAAFFSPWQAVLETTRHELEGLSGLGPLGQPTNGFLLFALALTCVLNGIAILRVRAWNTTREAAPTRALPEEAELSEASSIAGVSSPSIARSRRVWDNPIIWREIRTWAYGRRIIAVRVAYWLLFAVVLLGLYAAEAAGAPVVQERAKWLLTPLTLLSLVLVNAQAVTAITSERDARALDLLLVTDLTPKEIIFGKLGGIFYNTKEMVLLPMGLGIWLWARGAIGMENLLYLLGALAVLSLFAAMLGLHVGMTFSNSGVAVATSLGTVFFLFVGVAVCMRIMIAFSGSFSAQFLPFFAFMVFGGVGLYGVLGLRNPSTAIGMASLLCPFATFYALTSYLLMAPLAAFLVTAGAYGFATAAMLVPAIYEFDVATGRTTAEE